jgi:hypothetical protein
MSFAARALGLVALCLAPLAAEAQAGGQQRTNCGFTSDRFRTDSTAEGNVVFMAGNVVIRCPARKITIRGDSAERFPNRDLVIGHAVYDEPRLHVESDFLNHFMADERVLAIGNVNARLPNGSTLVGPIVEYRRANPRFRQRDQILAQSRPTITIMQKDSTGKPLPPTTVVGQTVFMDGDSLIYAGGQVVINRTDVTATADSMAMDQGRETMRLMRQPILKGKREREFTLTGDLIDVFSKNKKLQRIISQAKAQAVSDSMTLTADTIDLRVKDDLLDHAYAWGKSRARVVSPSQNMVADSLDVSLPGQRIRLVRALRGALAEGRPDTTRFRLESKDEKDWLRGDTIIALFDSTKVADTTKSNPDVERLIARGNATSLYHLAPNDTSQKRPAINYVSARTITIDFDQSRVATVTTVEAVNGLYLEPRDSTARRANGGQRANAPQRSSGRGQQPATPRPSSIVPLPPKRP